MPISPEKVKDSAWFKMKDGTPVLCDTPNFKEWCKISHLPTDRIARQIYNQWLKDAPTLLRVVQLIFDGEIQEASKTLNKIADSQLTKEQKEFHSWLR